METHTLNINHLSHSVSCSCGKWEIFNYTDLNNRFADHVREALAQEVPAYVLKCDNCGDNCTGFYATERTHWEVDEELFTDQDGAPVVNLTSASADGLDNGILCATCDKPITLPDNTQYNFN